MGTKPQLLDGKYRLGQILKQGDRALIVAANHIELREAVVVKVLHADEHDPRFAAKLKREARQSAALRSEHVVRYRDVGHIADGRPYVVMERLTGETLAERIAAHGPLSPAAVVNVVLQTCEALACAHVRGIIHRDLTTANLFCTQQFDGRMVIKVLNFGTARKVDASGAQEDQGMTVATLAFDTPDYKAPEQIVSRSNIDTRTDTWALGVIIYEMLTGVRPFAAPTAQESVRRLLSADLPPATQIPPDLWKVIRGCIALRREERWSSVINIAEALAHLAGPETASYPARIHQILNTPVVEESDPDDAEVPSVAAVTDLLALPHKTIVSPSPAPNMAQLASMAPPSMSRATPRHRPQPMVDTESGLPRLDDGHTSARSFPWMQLDQLHAPQKQASSRGKRIAIVLGSLTVAVAAILLIVPRFIRELRAAEERGPNTTTTANDSNRAALPAAVSPPQVGAAPPTPAVARAPGTPAVQSAPAVPAAAPVAADPGPAVVRKPGVAATGGRPAAAPISPPPRASTEGKDPFGWER